MIDWSFTPEVQALYDRVVENTRRLQKELGIKPMTLEERARAYQASKAERDRKEQELKEIQERLARRRPMPNWKV